MNTDLLRQIQEYNFAAYDMLLYLDTHPEDKKAFEMFKDLTEKLKALISEYEKNYGPLSPKSAAGGDNFEWLKNPWPWEKEANV